MGKQKIECRKFTEKGRKFVLIFVVRVAKYFNLQQHSYENFKTSKTLTVIVYYYYYY
jgi:hypothetical protein